MPKCPRIHDCLVVEDSRRILELAKYRAYLAFRVIEPACDFAEAHAPVPMQHRQHGKFALCIQFRQPGVGQFTESLFEIGLDLDNGAAVEAVLVIRQYHSRVRGLDCFDRGGGRCEQSFYVGCIAADHVEHDLFLVQLSADGNDLWNPCEFCCHRVAGVGPSRGDLHAADGEYFEACGADVGGCNHAHYACFLQLPDACADGGVRYAESLADSSVQNRGIGPQHVDDQAVALVGLVIHGPPVFQMLQPRTRCLS